MSRYIFPLLTLVALAIPAQAQCGSDACSCACSSGFSVYPEVTEGRRLPGQWWDDHTAYPVGPPANLAYGFVDNSHKPWSLIPGDGYVGASPDKAPEDEEESEGAEEFTPPPEPAPAASSEEKDGLGFGSKKEEPAKEEPAKEEAAKDDATPAAKDEPSRMKRDDRERRDMPRRRRRPFRRPEESEEQGAVSVPDADQSASLPAPPSPADDAKVTTPADDNSAAITETPADRAGLTLSLFGAAFLALMFSGHYARKACQAPRNQGPVTRI